ncbi:MAG: DUF1003 domain-containing protein [Nanoarchaeota archaeon]|nr:DUF1003 domain-containing protein [Nanoarchaeota archaeon]
MEKNGVSHSILKDKIGILRHLVIPQTFGQRAADGIAKWAGSWTFILSFMVILILWIILNTSMVLFGTWDLYPFILLNLVLSSLAALQAPVILMSQNRQSQKDRIKAEYDYRVNRRAERGIEQILARLGMIEDRLGKK